MNAMSESQIIVLATPVFLALIGVELAVGLARGRNGYRLSDALSSIGLGVQTLYIQAARGDTPEDRLGAAPGSHRRCARSAATTPR